MKKLILIIFTILMSSCSGMRYYNNYEFKKNYNISEKMFNKLLEERVTNKKLKKLKKHFIMLDRQLYEKNENYSRISQETVEKYSKEIQYYMMLIDDLED
ncbi:hypothetical protein [Fusobacterium sp. MFO224]|uniref:hypothetical protein n=1 Tax=Fusobacterium sp. MFO224 TaxID=3378070 RepID=UPI00385299A1